MPILHDESTYPDPHTFSLTGFLKASDSDGALRLDPDPPDPRAVVFGDERRLCPRQAMALDTLWIAIATVLAGEGAPGRSRGLMRVEAGGEPEMVNAVVVEPRLFACCVRLRSEAHAALLEP